VDGIDYIVRGERSGSGERKDKEPANMLESDGKRTEINPQF
jgi:hypothetical protein